MQIYTTMVYANSLNWRINNTFKSDMLTDSHMIQHQHTLLKQPTINPNHQQILLKASETCPRSIVGGELMLEVYWVHPISTRGDDLTSDTPVAGPVRLLLGSASANHPCHSHPIAVLSSGLLRQIRRWIPGSVWVGGGPYMNHVQHVGLQE